MAVPYPKTSAASDVPLSGGVDEYGGVKSNFQTNKIAGDPDAETYSTGALPKGVNEYGATEDLQEQGEAANKYGTKRIPGMS